MKNQTPNQELSSNTEAAAEITEEPIHIIGGGPKKVLYTLKTLARIGLRDSTKALKSKNTCKACGLGMGGQRGGMTNELGEFPSVCNKSIQAQSTDIQPPIPTELFQRHSIEDFQQLSAHELEHLGRLDTPLFKPAHGTHYSPISWDEAMTHLVENFQQSAPEQSFFYASGRSSNEAGFLLQLIARLYGTNNINNCSYYCHQATGVGLENTLGSGTATISLDDLQLSDCIVVIGANPASNHPRFIHQLLQCRERGGQVIVINPAREPGLVKFAVPKSAKSMLKGGSEIASHYVQPKIGGDLALLKGIAKALLETPGAVDGAFISEHTEGFQALRNDLRSEPWDKLTGISGVDKESILNLTKRLMRSENLVIAWGMGITHHRHGVENVEAIANLGLMLGMIGKPGAGLLPLRGHSNVQGIGTVGVKPELAQPVLEKLQRELKLNLPTHKGMDTLACLHAASEGRMEAAMLLGGNLYAATPNSAWAAKALDQIRFKAYLTTTLNAGHFSGVASGCALVLPVRARDEEEQPTTQESMFNYVRMSDGGIERLHHVRSETAILAEFGERLLIHCPVNISALKSHNAIRQLIAKCIPGLQGLADIDKSKAEFTIPQRIFHEPRFNRSNTRAAFRITPLLADARSPDSQEAADYPFMLASIRSEGQFNSIIYEEYDSYRNNAPRNALLMNRNDMQKLGISDDANVTVKSPHGEITQMHARAFQLPPGNVMAYYPEANALIGLAQDARSKTPAFKSVPVAVVVCEQAVAV